jgi:hypothetical protein
MFNEKEENYRKMKAERIEVESKSIKYMPEKEGWATMKANREPAH